MSVSYPKHPAMRLGRKDSDAYPRLSKYWEIGIAVLLASISVFFSRSAVEESLRSGSMPATLVVTRLFVAIIWLVIYIDGTQEELVFLRGARVLETGTLEKAGVRAGLAMLLGVVGIAVILGALVAFSADLVLYAFLAVAIKTIDSVGHSVTSRAVYRAVLSHSSAISASQKTVYDYWLGRPQSLRNIAMLSGFYIAAILALLARHSHGQLDALSTIILTLTIFVGEVTIGIWRFSRRRLTGLYTATE